MENQFRSIHFLLMNSLHKSRLGLFCLSLFMCFNSFGSVSQNTEIFISTSQKLSVEEVFKIIQQQTAHNFVFKSDLFNGAPQVLVAEGKTTVGNLLNVSLKSTGVQYKFTEDGNIILEAKPGESSILFQMIVSGQVRDDTNLPLPGVAVMVEGTNIGTVTDMDGRFSLEVPMNSRLVFSFLSFVTQTIEVGDQSNFDIVMQPALNTLNEVVITGYTSYNANQAASAVSTVSAEQINQVPASSFSDILQGRVSGMSVITGSGQPGSSPSVTIRGIGSIDGSTQPLYVLDGIPVESSYFQSINPNDIKSVTVLKDASAKALYGSRGSNGVIVIESKSGRKGAISYQYATQYGASELTRPNFVMMNTEERLRFEEEVGLEIGRDIGPGWTYSPRNPGYGQWSPQEQQEADFILDSLRQIKVDWRDMFFQTGTYNEHQISASGGGDAVTFYNSLNYVEQEGIVKSTGLNRFSLRSNVAYTDGNFEAKINLSLGYSQSRFTYNEGGTSVGSPMASVYYALPYEYPYSPDGVLIPSGNFLDLREGSRGLDVLQNTSSKTDQLKSIAGIDLRYHLAPGLTISTRAGMDYRNSTDEDYINPDSYIGSRNNSTTLGGSGAFGEGSRRNFNLISTSGITFQKNLQDRHDFEISGFYEYLYNHYRSFNYRGFGIDERLPETPAGITVNEIYLPSLGGGRTYNALASIMGVGRYTLDNKYTITGSYRYDGSSKVPKHNRWQGFYSIGGSWNAKQENFLIDMETISTLRFRMSYGQTASQFGGDFLYLPTYSVNTSYGGNPAIRPSAAGNRDFDWEYVDEFNVGFDIGLFTNDRLSLSADYYNRITNNMFIDQPLSATAGFPSLPLSTGKMRNSGFEMDLNAYVFNTADFMWNLGVNLGYNKNEILHVTDQTDELPDGDTRIIKVGLPYGSYYAPQWAGVNPDTGEAQYYTPEGEITTDYDYDRLAVAQSGSLYPTLTGGVSTAASWKNLSVSALFSFVSDVMRWNNENFYNENQRYMSSNQSVRMLYDRWKQPGDQAILQRIDVPRNFTSNDIEDASFVRLRNVKLTYSLDRRILDRVNFLEGASIFLQGQNLYTWTNWRGLDPENYQALGRFDYPSAKTYTVGLNINF